MIKISNLSLDTDFEYRIIREDENDIDIFVDVNYRSVQINRKDMIYLHQDSIPICRSMILRISKLNHLMTIHFMRDIDLFSAFANFEIDYTDSVIRIKNDYEKVIFSKDSLDNKRSLISSFLSMCIIYSLKAISIFSYPKLFNVFSKLFFVLVFTSSIKPSSITLASYSSLCLDNSSNTSFTSLC